LRIAVIGEGVVRQIGSAEQIFREPESEFVARFAMTRNILKGKAQRGNGGTALFDTGEMSLLISTEREGPCHASIRPEDIIISHAPFSADVPNTFSGTITNINDRGTTIYITVMVPPDFVCLVNRNTFRALGLGVGNHVYIAFDPSSIHVF
jgi:ABC-type Fe3+/spermidine/putrescine transport system ATPase subunit